LIANNPSAKKADELKKHTKQTRQRLRMEIKETMIQEMK
jgi:hypothetical protein